MFQAFFKCTKSTKLRDFQFRLLHNIVITNCQLFKWKKRDDDLCTFCKKDNESIIHLLLRCEVSKAIWTYVEHKLYLLSKTHIEFTESEKLLGIENNSYADMYNTIFIVIKQYLYASKCLDIKPCNEVILEKIKEVKQIELNVARRIRVM